MEENIIVCQKCGEINPDTNNFCQKCGNPLKNIMQSAPQNTPEVKPEEQQKKKPGKKDAAPTESNDTSEVKPKKKKKGCLVAVLVVVILIVIVAVATSAGGDKNTATTTTPENQTSEATKPTEPTTIAVDQQLTSGYYTAGIDFPSGTYDIEAVSGSGNVSSSNLDINAVMGTADANESLGTDLYEQQYSNIDLSDGVVLSVSGGVTIRITSAAADGGALEKREQPNTETVDLGNGNFEAGKDFPAGTYDITATSGSGNVSTSNLSINAIMGTSNSNNSLGIDMYEQKYKNIELKEGSTLTIDGVDIQLTPSK